MLHALFELYRRTLWFLTVVLVFSLVTFTLAKAPALSSDLPLFVNAKPKALSNYAWTLAQSIANDGPKANSSRLELARLGAVALPHVLPKLDSLPPEGRGYVLQALEPVAARMGLSQAQGNVSQLAGTWLTYLSDNSVYLHPAMAKRVVARFIADPNAQHTRDLRRLDTFALRELIRSLRQSARNQLPYESAFKIIEMLRQITAHDSTWSLPPVTDSEAKASAVLERWQRWWFAERHLYEQPTATTHLTAPLLQTQFALWVRGGAGVWLDRSATDTLRAIPWMALLRSVSLFVIAVFGGNAIARYCTPARHATQVRDVLRVGVACFGLLPIALLAVAAERMEITGMWIAAPTVALFGAALTLRPRPRTAQPLPAQPITAGSYTATLLCACLVVECALRIDGLGSIVVAAVTQADATSVLCVALVNTFLIGVVQYVSARPARQPA
jgi:hypothetical protein